MRPQYQSAYLPKQLASNKKVGGEGRGGGQHMSTKSDQMEYLCDMVKLSAGPLKSRASDASKNVLKFCSVGMQPKGTSRAQAS
jgi:hypothetical protein